MIETRINRSGAEVVGRAHRVDVAGEVQVEILHRDHLAVAAARRTAFDAKGRPHRGLANGADGFVTQRTERLRQADGGGGLPLA